MIAAIERVVFNRGLEFTNVVLEDFQYPTVNWKYASLDHVLKTSSTNDTIRSIVAQCPLQNKHKRVLIDVKVQHLVPSVTSCIPGWHLDGPENPLHPSKPEIHHLYIHEIGGETEFIGEEFELDVDPQMSQIKLVENIPMNLPVIKTMAKHFATFTRFDFHRGINVRKPMTRLLVRLTETDTIIPRNKPYFGAVGTKIN